MLTENQAIKWLFVTLLVLLVLPLIAMIAMMPIGARGASMMSGKMMSRMGGMMDGAGTMGMSGSAMALGLLWMVLVPAALIFLIVLLVRSASRA